MEGRRAAERSSEAGATIAEVLMVAAFVVSITGIAVPLTAQAADTARVRSAASYLTGRVRLTQLRAVIGHRATALVLDQIDTRWTFRICEDGNGNGVRRTDIASATDECRGAPEPVADQFPGISLALGAGIPDIDGAVGDRSGVRFGRSAMVSCTPVGHCTPGTLYLLSGRGRQFAVRVAGVTGRVRRLQFETGERRWTVD